MQSDPNKIRIVPASLEFSDSFWECLDSVARERKWLLIVEAFPKEEVRQFISKNLADRSAQFFALLDGQVIGWADLRVDQRETVRHRGLLGMGVHKDFRGQGIGERLLQAVVAAAKTRGLMRIDLTVYASNPAAIALYRKFGFVQEGCMVKGHYLDGCFDDIIYMGLIFPENVPNSINSAAPDEPGR